MQPDDDAAQDADSALHVVGVGNALVDVLSSATDDDLTRLGLLKGTMALVDAERSRRIYEVMGPTVESSGGSAANTVAGVAALGGRAAFLGRVADDPLGRTFIHDIRSAGVAFEPMAPKAGAGDGDGDGARGGEGDGDGDGSGTGHCLVLVTPDAERTMATHLGVASDFSHVDLHDGHLTSARVAYFEGYLWERAQARAAMRTAMARAHAADATVALSLSDPVCVSHHRREWLDLLTGEVDLVFANEEEVVMLFGVTGFEAAVEAVAETGVLAALTRGSRGSVVVTPTGVIEVGAHDVEKVVDTTGAGDLFAAGFLYGITSGLAPEESAVLGGLCAAEVISHVGARPLADLRALAVGEGLLG